MAIGLVLSGGGAKGSFQIGAIHYLYSHHIRPRIITGTSVGAINAIKLAEGETAPADYRPGSKGLEDLWLGLRTEQDMYRAEPAFDGLEDRVKGLLLVAVAGNVIAPWVGIIPGVVAVLEAGDEIDEFLQSSALYNLGPIETKMRASSLRLELVRDSGIRLLVATVGLNSGALRYIDGEGYVFAARDLFSSVGGPIDPIDGVLASAAVPAVFTPRTFLGEPHVDGGVREVVPIRAAVQAGANEVFAVVCDPPLAAKPAPQTKGLEDIIGQVTEIALDELRNNDIWPDHPWDRPVWLIQPNLDVHSSREIDPGLIRINFAYGYLRTDDAIGRRLGPLARRYSAGLSDAIAWMRRQIWDLERELRHNFDQVQQWLDRWKPELDANIDTENAAAATTVPAIRVKKCELKALIERRTRVAGSDSLPEDAASWPLHWERHQIDLPGTPWDAVLSLKHNPHGGLPLSIVIAPAEAPCPVAAPPAPEERRFWKHPGASSPQGAYLQSDFGGRGNFELLVVERGRAVHYWRENDSSGFPWHPGETLPMPSGQVVSRGGVMTVPHTEVEAISFFQSRNREGGHGRFEAIGLVHGLTGNHLVTWSYSPAENRWHGPVALSADGTPISDVSGRPVMIESDWDHFELLVPKNGELLHFWRDTGAHWHAGGALPAGPTGNVHQVTGVSFIQSNLVVGDDEHGFFEVVARVSSRFDENDNHLVQYRFDPAARAWQGPVVIRVQGQPVTGTRGRMGLVQGDYGPQGNLELLVVMDDGVAHFWRDNSDPALGWHRNPNLPVADSPAPASGLTAAQRFAPSDVSLFVSNFREASSKIGSLEALVRVQSLDGASSWLATCWLSAGAPWRGPVPVSAEGQPVTGVAPL